MKKLFCTLIIIAVALFSYGQQINGRLSWSNDIEAHGTKNFDLPPMGKYVPSEFVVCKGPHLISVNTDYSIIKDGYSIKWVVNHSNFENNNMLYYNYKGMKTASLSDFGMGTRVSIGVRATLLFKANGKSEEIKLSLDNGNREEIGNYCEYLGICNEFGSVDVSIIKVEYTLKNLSELVNAFKPYFMQNIYKAPNQTETGQQQSSNSTNNIQNSITSNNNYSRQNSDNSYDVSNQNTNSAQDQLTKQNYNYEDDPYYQQLKQRNAELNSQLDQTIQDGVNLAADVFNYYYEAKKEKERWANQQKEYYERKTINNSKLSHEQLGRDEPSYYINGKSYGYFHYWKCNGFKPFDGGFANICRENETDFFPKFNGSRLTNSEFNLHEGTVPGFKKRNTILNWNGKRKVKQISNSFWPDHELSNAQRILHSYKNYYYSGISMYLAEFSDPQFVFSDFLYGWTISSKDKIGISYYSPLYIILNTENNTFCKKFPFAFSKESGKAVQVWHNFTDKTLVFDHYLSFESLINEDIDYQKTYSIDLYKRKTEVHWWRGTEQTPEYIDLLRISKSGEYYLYVNSERLEDNIGHLSFFYTTYLFNYKTRKMICEFPTNLLRLINIYFNEENNLVVVGIDKYECLVKKIYDIKKIEAFYTSDHEKISLQLKTDHYKFSNNNEQQRSIGNSTDFWGDENKEVGEKNQKENKTSDQKTDFWGNKVQIDTTLEAKQTDSVNDKKAPVSNQKLDFWGNPEKNNP